MIEEGKGNIIESDVEALVNTVNTVGVMGKGVALQYKIAFPDMFIEYQRACKNGQVQIGKMHIFKHRSLSNPKFIINFPTKAHWKENSDLSYIRDGLKSLISEIQYNNIHSIALPPLGCGMGGLKWTEVYPLIREAFQEIPNVRVVIFSPGQNVGPYNTAVKTHRPVMNWVRASAIKIMGQYPVLGYELTLLEINKLLYFLQEAGEHSLHLKYEKKAFGPYADNLRHLLISFEGHYISGFASGSTKPSTPIKLKKEALVAAEKYIDSNRFSHQENEKLISRVLELIEGFESPYGLELLSTIHWTIKHENYDPKNSQEIINHIHSWNDRKKANNETRTYQNRFKTFGRSRLD